MRKMMKLTAITMMAALLLCMVITCASAEDRIYTSPVFRLPADRILRWLADQIEEPEIPAEEPAEPAEQPAEPAEQPAEPAEQPAEPAEQPAAQNEQPAKENKKPAEQKAQPADTNPQPEEPDTQSGEPDAAAEPAGSNEPEPEEGTAERPERAVLIFSSQSSVVTEGEIIYLTSELIGFDGGEVSYQWQVDRGDGLGWVDVEGATRDKHMFVASRETIRYSWRLLVHYSGE